MRVARLYGERLDKYGRILKDGVATLNKLINSYPSHAFVIDRNEARELFSKVRAPTESEQVFGKVIANIDKPYSSPKVDLVRSIVKGKRS